MSNVGVFLDRSELYSKKERRWKLPRRNKKTMLRGLRELQIGREEREGKNLLVQRKWRKKQESHIGKDKAAYVN